MSVQGEGFCRTAMKRRLRPWADCRGFASLPTPLRGKKREGTDPFYGSPVSEGKAAICLSRSRFWRLLTRGGTSPPAKIALPWAPQERSQAARRGGEPPAPGQAQRRQPQLVLTALSWHTGPCVGPAAGAPHGPSRPQGPGTGAGPLCGPGRGCPSPH